jgi:hypothetical protein
MRLQHILGGLGAVILLIGSLVWTINLFHSLDKYKAYYQTTNEQNIEKALPYYAWNDGKYFNLSLIILLFFWIPFTDYFLRKSVYPFLRKKLVYRDAKIYSRTVSRSLYEKIYGLVLGYFTRVNRKVNAKISLWFMKIETFEHVHLLTKVFKWFVMPSSAIYGVAMFIFFGRNALGSILIANFMFFYSNFVPDLPAIFRRKIYRDERDNLQEELPQHKSYALMLLAPVFIFLLFCGKTIKWKTTETFHNFKSFAVYGIFLFILGLIDLMVFQISIEHTIEIIWVLLLSLLGYLTHLKVDEVF